VCVIVIVVASLPDQVFSGDLSPVFAARPFQVIVVSSSAFVANVQSPDRESGLDKMMCVLNEASLALVTSRSSFDGLKYGVAGGFGLHISDIWTRHYVVGGDSW